ncbi:MAG TPA: SpoIIE family protein phosphatase [Victivallales bacterium]|nr:SpoIIE family protein phosphatase [Victivallales bacterium]
MFKKRKIKLAFLFISLSTVILVLLSIALSSISLSSVTKLGNVAVSIDIENTEKISTTLFKEIAYRSAKEYSNHFNEVNDLTAIMSNQVKQRIKYNTGSEHISNFIKLQRYKNTNYYINSLDNVNAIYWGKDGGNMPDSILKSMNSIAELFPTYSNLFTRNLNILSIWVLDNKNYCLVYPHRFFYNKPNVIKSIEKDYKKIIFIQKNVLKFDKNATVFWTPPYIDIITGKSVMSVYSPIKDSSGKSVAFVGIDLNYNKTVNSLLLSDILQDKHSTLSEKAINGKYNGFIFILDRKGYIIALPNEYYSLFSLSKHTDSSLYNLVLTSQDKLNASSNQAVRNLSDKMLKLGSGTEFLKINNQNYIVAFSRINFTGWTLGYVLNQNSLIKLTSRTKDEITKTENIMKIHFILISLLFLFLSIFFAIFFFSRFFLKPINRIRQNIKKMGHGHFDINIKESVISEIGELASTFNYLGEELNNYMENLKTEVKARQAYETEINIAADLQKSILPKVTPEFSNDYFNLFATLKPAKYVSGDFYDFFYINENKIALLIADVSGKGIQAALFMSMAKALLKSYCLTEHNDPAKVLEKTNNYLCIDNEYKMFVTVFLAYLNYETGELTYANAGHHSSILASGDGKYENFGLLDGVILGFFPDTKFNSGSKLLKKDDLVVMYTDGVFEAVSPVNKEYGEERLMDLIVKNRNLEINEICLSILSDLEVFEQGSRFDDVTLVALRKN